MSGFIGSTVEKRITTLGRSGSDFTATILGKYLKAKQINIYTDVDGILSSDPQKVQSAKTLNEISIKEMAEMSYFGANVLHSKTLIPIENENIKLKILNTFNLENPGTTIIKN